MNNAIQNAYGSVYPHFDRVASSSSSSSSSSVLFLPHFDRYTSSQPSASSLLHVGVRAPQDAGLPLREPRLTSD